MCSTHCDTAYSGAIWITSLNKLCKVNKRLSYKLASSHHSGASVLWVCPLEGSSDSRLDLKHYIDFLYLRPTEVGELDLSSSWKFLFLLSIFATTSYFCFLSVWKCWLKGSERCKENNLTKPWTSRAIITVPLFSLPTICKSKSAMCNDLFGAIDCNQQGCYYYRGNPVKKAFKGSKHYCL